MRDRNRRITLWTFVVVVLMMIIPTLIKAQLTAYPPYSIFNTEIRFVHSTNVDRVFKLFINLPRSYHQEPERRYPTLYLLDPDVGDLHGRLLSLRSPDLSIITSAEAFVQEAPPSATAQTWCAVHAPPSGRCAGRETRRRR